MYYTTSYRSPIGALALLCDETRLCGLWIAGQKYYGDRQLDGAVENGDAPVLLRAVEWLDGYFAGDAPSLSGLLLAPEGSEFSLGVWELLREIPYGETRSYGGLAKTLAENTGRERVSARSVGGAVGHNPISIIIPCHRVIGWDGSLTGYAGGMEIKKWLLELEGRK
jgi:methylated-DNA-[protein]-cysteine S-methyltransferase